MDTKICTKCGLERDEKEFGGKDQEKDMSAVSLAVFKTVWTVTKETRKKNWNINGIVRLQNVRKPVYMFLLI
jgi:hypothetical protein